MCLDTSGTTLSGEILPNLVKIDLKWSNTTEGHCKNGI